MESLMAKHKMNTIDRVRITNMVNQLSEILERIAEENDVTLRDVNRLRGMKRDLIEIAKLDTSYWVNDESQIYRNSYKYVLSESEYAYEVAYKKAQKTEKHGKAGKRGSRTTAKAS